MNSLSDFLLSAWSGVVGNILFLGVIILAGYLIRYMPRRRGIRRFFLKKRHQPVHIILSNVSVTAGGAVGVGGVTYSFANAAIPVMEAEVAQRFPGALLSAIPGLANQPGWLSAVAVNEFPVDIAPSPSSGTLAPRGGTIIAVGGPAYNAVSAMIEHSLNPPVRFSGAAIVFASGVRVNDPAVGFACRFIDVKNDRYVFYVAGPSEEATAASLHYLIEAWSDLERRYRGQSSFAIAVRCLRSGPIQSKVEFYT